MSRIRIGCCSCIYEGYPLEEAMRRIADAGYDGVEVAVSMHANPGLVGSGERERLGRLAGSYGLEVAALHGLYPPGVSLMTPSGEERRAAVEYGLACLGLARDLGAGVVVFGSPAARAVPAGVRREEAWGWAVDFLRRWSEAAERAGVCIAVEPLNRYETNFVNDVGQALDLAGAVGSTAVKVMVDTFHVNIEERSFRDAIRRAGGGLAHVHVSDSNRQAPGRGHIDFEEVFRALREVDYRGYVSLELFKTYFGRPLEGEPDTIIRQSRRYLERLL